MRLPSHIVATVVALAAVAAATDSLHHHSALSSVGGQGAVVRQTRQLTTTTPKPRKRRPSNFFSLVSVLLSETRNDTRNALNEIGVLFNSQFAPPNTTRTTPAEMPSTSEMTPSDGDGEEGGDGDEPTTTTEPYRITREEFQGIIRSNVQGLIRLFGKELGNAIRDSNKNVREFGRSFRESLRPYVTGG